MSAVRTNKGLLAGLLVFLVGVAVVFTALYDKAGDVPLSAIPTATPEPLLRVDEPSLVTNRVEGIDGPALRQGEQFRLEFRQCNETDGTLSVRISGTFRKYFDSNTELPIFQGITDNIETGCDLGMISLNLPGSTLSAGTWDFVLAYDIIRDDVVVQQGRLASVKFQVIPLP